MNSPYARWAGSLLLIGGTGLLIWAALGWVGVFVLWAIIGGGWQLAELGDDGFGDDDE